MFGQLPKLFDRNFVIGYFLPSAVWVTTTHWIMASLHWPSSFLITFLPTTEASYWNLANFSLFSLLGGVALLIINRGITRFMEGYWLLRLKGNSNCLEKWRDKRLQKKIAKLDAKDKCYEARGIQLPAEDDIKLNRLYRKRVDQFPHDESLILPTSFGNILRAFEVYPYVMYGIDAIPGWYRMLAVVPEKYQDKINEAKTIMDFWLNLSFIGLLVLIEYIGFGIAGICAGRLKIPVLSFWAVINGGLVPIATVVFSYVAYCLAKGPAVIWGNWVKSAFDLYLTELRTKLAFASAPDAEAEIKLWQQFSTAVLYRDPEEMPDRGIPDGPEPYSNALKMGQNQCRRKITEDAP